MPLSPIIGWARVLSACLCEDLRGLKEEEETSWNRICWWGNSPIAGKCLSIKEAVQGVSMQECSNSLRVFSIFLFLSPHQCLIYLSSTKLYLNSGEIVFLTQFFLCLQENPQNIHLVPRNKQIKFNPGRILNQWVFSTSRKCILEIYWVFIASFFLLGILMTETPNEKAPRDSGWRNRHKNTSFAQ